MPSFTFSGSIVAAEKWLPFAVAQRANYLANGIKSTNIAPISGVMIMIREDHIHIIAGGSSFDSGGAHTIAISNGTVWACGLNDTGQLGLGDTVDRDVFTDTGIKASHVAAGEFHSLSITDGKVWGAGANTAGQLGVGTNLTQYHDWTDTGFKAVDIDVFWYSSMALSKVVQPDDFVLKIAFGTGGINAGNMGFPGNSNEFKSSSQAFDKISVGANHTLGMLDGFLWVTGVGSSGEFGMGVDGPSVQYDHFINTGIAVEDIAAGEQFSLIIKNGTVWGAGLNFFGVLGVGSAVGDGTEVPAVQSYTTTFIDTGVIASSISASANHSMCISNGLVMACGHNLFGELALGTNTAQEKVFKQAIDESGDPIAADKIMACAYRSLVSSNGVLFTVGLNDKSCLGLGDAIDRNVFTSTGLSV